MVTVPVGVVLVGRRVAGGDPSLGERRGVLAVHRGDVLDAAAAGQAAPAALLAQEKRWIIK